MTASSKVLELSRQILSRLPTKASPKVGIVLGSGWSHYGNSLDGLVQIPYNEAGLPVSQVSGHSNMFAYGLKFGLDVLMMQGRLHHYEGYDLETVVLPIRALIQCGCQIIILTNAAGGIQPGMVAGQLAVITDHINLLANSPLLGPNDPALGTRFPDMTEAYDPALQEIAHRAAQQRHIRLGSGVYAGVLGPQYETPAEVRMLSILGADLTGMSTVAETIAARHMGARVLGISLVSNIAAGLSGSPLSHEEVSATAAASQHQYVSLLDGILETLAHEVFV